MQKVLQNTEIFEQCNRSGQCWKRIKENKEIDGIEKKCNESEIEYK